jgi:hypothetical protein
MSKRAEGAIVARFRKMAEDHRMAYVPAAGDALARQSASLAGDDVQLDEIEELLVALQRRGHPSRTKMIQLQAAYLREARP